MRRSARPPRGRIIPARAGFTRQFALASTAGEDHPRSRGVYPESICRYCSMAGSSPLARGLQECRVELVEGDRIIPARAGFTPSSTGSTGGWPDHPRSRGVYRATGHFERVMWGSSPLARGLRTPVLTVVNELRIIPARAGFTPRRSPGAWPAQDHPRSRGVYPAPTGREAKPPGSSPLARGLRLALSRTAGHPGIIPARAGFTWSRAGRRRG